MPLADGHLADAVFGVRRFRKAEILRHNLAVHQPNQRRFADFQLLRRHVRQMHRVQHAGKNIAIHRRLLHQRLLPVVDHRATLENHLHIHIMQIVQHHKIRQIPRRNRALVVQQEVARRIVAGYLDGQDGICPQPDRLAHNIVNMPPVKQIIGMLVVGSEHAAMGVLLRQQGHQRLQILCSRAFANHDKLPLAQLFQRVVQRAAFVVGIDTGGHVGIERLARKPRRMAINLLVMRLRNDDFLNRTSFTHQHAGIVHHFRQPQHTRMVKIRIDVAP